MKMVSRIPECEEKYLLKLKQDIINTHFSINRVNNTQSLMPLTSTNSSTSIPHSGSLFLQKQMAASPQVFENFQ